MSTHKTFYSEFKAVALRIFKKIYTKIYNSLTPEEQQELDTEIFLLKCLFNFSKHINS